MFPILLSLGPIKIYSFGVFLVLAIVVASFIIWREGRNQKLDEERLVDFLLVEAIFALVGGRIFYLILHYSDFGLDVFRWILIFHFPGLTFIGAIIGGLIGLLVFAKKMSWSVYQIGDFLVLGVSLGEAIGRIGAFLSGSAYGAVTTLPWGVTMSGLLGRRHPVQIYEALIAFLTFVILFKLKNLWQAKKSPTGLVFLLYFWLLGATRFLLEFFRGDSVYFDGWQVNQPIYLSFALVACILIYVRLGRSVKTDLLIIFDKIKNRH